MGADPPPVGRRVAYWRGRRKLTQQVFADRLGKSKSWVDKVERGVRSLDKVSTLQEIAAVLEIEAGLLLGGVAQPLEVAGRVDGVERIRAALSTYEVALGRPMVGRVPSVERVAAGVGHAWSTYRHAGYPQLVARVPGLLVSAERTRADDPDRGRGPLVEAYRVTASLLVKLDETDLAWFAADRALAVASGDRVLVAAAAVQLGQVLRAAGRVRAARSVALAAAYRLAPPDPDDGPPEELSLCGTLLVQAALAAAAHGDGRAAGTLLDEATDLAVRVGDGRDHHRTGFGPTAVDLARSAVAVASGDRCEAVAWHEKAIGRDGWRWLAAEHRAAHLLDTARAHLLAGDPASTGRLLLAADRIAPAEIRHRPAGRDVLARVARDPAAPRTIIHLASAAGLA